MLSANAQAQGGDAELARVLGERRILIKGGVVLSLDREVGDFAQADVLIEDGKIREVRSGVVADAAAVVDAANRIVIPGFIDTHHHFYQGILRNILANGLLNPDYQRDIAGTLTAVYQPADVYAGELVTALGMIEHGTTTNPDNVGKVIDQTPAAKLSVPKGSTVTVTLATTSVLGVTVDRGATNNAAPNLAKTGGVVSAGLALWLLISGLLSQLAGSERLWRLARRLGR